MVDVKVGDRVSIDAFKVGQPRRSGVVKDVTKGISGSRLSIEWDDGSRTSLMPGAGNLIVEGRRSKAKKTNSKKASGSKKPKAKRKR